MKRHHFWLFMALGAALLFGLITASRADAAGPFDRFAGRWVGTAQVRAGENGLERLSCVATYIPVGESLRVNLRCAAHSGWKIEVKAVMRSAGTNSIVGTFHELIYDIHGTLSGVVTDMSIMGLIANDQVSKVMIERGGALMRVHTRDFGVISIEFSRRG